jgi:outer membrane PBP1 activator LpoA protein
MRKCVLLLLVLMVLAFAFSGCTGMTAAEKSWIQDKANRSTAYVALMDKGQTTADQDKAWIHSQDASWQLWAEKLKIGAAAPTTP